MDREIPQTIPGVVAMKRRVFFGIAGIAVFSRHREPAQLLPVEARQILQGKSCFKVGARHSSAVFRKKWFPGWRLRRMRDVPGRRIVFYSLDRKPPVTDSVQQPGCYADRRAPEAVRYAGSDTPKNKNGSHHLEAALLLCRDD